MDVVLLLQQSTFGRNRTLLHKEEKGLTRTLQSRAWFPTPIRTYWEHNAPSQPTSHPRSQDSSWSCFFSLEASKFWTISKLDSSGTFEDFTAA